MKTTTNVQSGYLCHCLRITVEDFEKMIAENPRRGLCRAEGEERHRVEMQQLRVRGEGPHPRGAAHQQCGAPREPGKACAAKHRTRPPCLPRHARRPQDRALHILLGNLLHAPSRPGIAARGFQTSPFPSAGRTRMAKRVSFKARLFGDNGQLLAESKSIVVPNNGSRELTIDEMFPGFRDDFTGSLYVDFPELFQTGSLRPYGILTANSNSQARCHYHDKFGYFRETRLRAQHLALRARADDMVRRVELPESPVPYRGVPQGRRQKDFRALRASADGQLLGEARGLFGAKNIPEKRSPALFWLESSQHVMAYFFWHNEASNTWTGQHH